MLLQCLSYSLLLFAYCVTPVGNFNCIEPSEIRERALHVECIPPKEYHYLWDPSSATFIEDCFDTKMVPEGMMPVLDKSSNNINAVECPEETFQPSSYRSNTQSCCGSIKSKCNQTGLMISSDGSSSKDRSCVCDYRKGYAPNNTLRNGCFCLPKKEDCTCKLKNCEKGSKLSPDYDCVKEEDYQITTFKCPEVVKDDRYNSTAVIPTEGTTRYKSTAVIPTVRTTSKTQTNATTEGGGTTTEIKTTIIGLVLACVLCFVAGIFLERKKKISECWSTVLSTVDNCNLTDLTSVKSEQQENSTNTDDLAIDDSEGMDTVERIPMLTKGVEDSKKLLDDQGYENDNRDTLETEEQEASHYVSTSHKLEDCDESDDCDIMIISIRESNEQAEEYRQHLETLKRKFDMPSIQIRLLPNDKSMSSKLEEILKSCLHIFIFVTETFSIESFKAEVDYHHLKLKYFEDHTNIDRVKVVYGDNTIIPAELYALNTIPFSNWMHEEQTYNTRMHNYFNRIMMKKNWMYERR